MAKAATKKTTPKKKAAPKKAPAKKAPEKAPEKAAEETPKVAELRLSPLEQAELNLCDRDYELSMKDIELANAKLRNLDMDYQTKKGKLVSILKSSQQRSEQLAMIRNHKLAEIEKRLRAIDENFSFQGYLEQDDGLLVPNEDKIASLDPTAGDGNGGDSVTA